MDFVKGEGKIFGRFLWWGREYCVGNSTAGYKRLSCKGGQVPAEETNPDTKCTVPKTDQTPQPPPPEFDWADYSDCATVNATTGAIVISNDDAVCTQAKCNELIAALDADNYQVLVEWDAYAKCRLTNYAGVCYAQPTKNVGGDEWIHFMWVPSTCSRTALASYGDNLTTGACATFAPVSPATALTFVGTDGKGTCPSKVYGEAGSYLTESQCDAMEDITSGITATFAEIAAAGTCSDSDHDGNEADCGTTGGTWTAKGTCETNEKTSDTSASACATLNGGTATAPEAPWTAGTCRVSISGYP